MKGRQNYLCPRRLERALQQANELFTGPETKRGETFGGMGAHDARRFAERSIGRILIRKYGHKSVASRTSVRKRRVAATRVVSITTRESVSKRLIS